MITETTEVVVTNPGLFRPRNLLIATGVGALVVGGVWYYRKRKAKKNAASNVADTLTEDKSNGDDKDKSTGDDKDKSE